MKHEHDPRLPWRNPESVPISQIPDGWRLMLPGDEGWPKNACVTWSTKETFCLDADKNAGLCEGWTFIIPSTVPLPEEFREPEAKPVVTVDNYGKIELRDWFAGQALMGVEATWEGDWQNETWCTEAAQHCYQMADAMLKAREAKP